MVGIRRAWSAAFAANAGQIKAALGVIVDRRNRIVHACDCDPLTPGQVIPLSSADALDAIETVEQVVAGIEQLC